MPQIRAVLFDYGLVLSGPPDPMARQRMESVLHTTHAELRDAYWRHREDYDLGILNGASFWRTVGAELGHPLTDDELTELLQADLDLWTQPNQPMIDWAIALQTASVSTGILSNMGDAMETGITDRFPWISGFQHRVFSHSVGIVKPNERIYRLTIAEVGQPSDAVLFIDDRIENVEAARATGMVAIPYTSHEDFLREFHGSDLTGLPLPAPVSTASTS